VILPGAAYVEKSGTWVNTEGRAQRGFPAVPPPGEAREDWTILRAFSAVLGKPLPYDTIDALRDRMAQVAPVFGRIGHLPRLICTDLNGPVAGGGFDGAAFVPAVPNYYATDPISRASPTMAKCIETYVTPRTLQAAE
jgi:NADH-quinone oxidoreductase subunit G